MLVIGTSSAVRSLDDRELRRTGGGVDMIGSTGVAVVEVVFGAGLVGVVAPVVAAVFEGDAVFVVALVMLADPAASVGRRRPMVATEGEAVLREV